MKKRGIPLIVSLLILLTGCVEKEIIDDVNIEMGVGYDLKEDDEIEGTIMIPVFNPDKKIGNFTFSGIATSSRDLLIELQRKSAQPIVSGSLEIAIFGKRIAQKGIIEYLDAFERDPSIGARVYLAVADGTAKDILTGDYGDRGNAVHLSDLIKHNTDLENLPVTNLHFFLSKFYQKGQDSFLPILKQVEKGVVEIVGIALFKEDKMVGSIPPEKLFYFKLLTDQYSEGTYRMSLEDEEVMIKDLNSKHKLRLKNRNPYHITVELEIEGIIREYTGQIINPSIVKKVQKKLESQITKEVEAMIASFQEQGIDPIGFGHFIKTRTKGFDYKKWQDEYKSLKVTVKTDAKITEVGIVE